MLKKTGRNMTLKKAFCMTLMMLFCMPVIGYCFEVISYVDKNKITRDDSVLLTVVVEGSKAQLDLSMIKDFQVISRGKSSSTNIINGTVTRKVTYQYILLPLKKGTLLIPPIQGALDGELKFSKQIVIQVVDQMVKSDNQKALYATSQIIKDTLFVGEQAVYSLRFFTSRRLSGLGFEIQPSFDGFSSKSFGKEKNFGQNINGVQYQVTQVDFILIPQSPGNFKIDPAVLIANVMVKSKRDPRFESFFNDSFFSSNSYKPVRIASNPIEIKVIPIPIYNGEKKFSGLVGQFDIEAIMETTDFKAGDSSTLTLKISGIGNIMDASLPDLNLDDQVFKVYDDNPVESVELTPKGYEGYKIFKKALVPISPGKFIIPSIELIYFDVTQKNYQTILTEPIHIDVLPSGKLQQVDSVEPGQSFKQSIVKKEVHYENKDIFEIKEGLQVLENFQQIPPSLFLIYLFIPCFLFLGVKVFVIMQKKDVPVKKQMGEKAKKHIQQAGKMEIGDDRFLGHVYSALVAMVLSKGHKKGESLTMEETASILEEANVEKKEADNIVQLFEIIDSVRFGGHKIDENQAKSLLTQTKKMIKLVGLALICLGMFFIAPQKSYADSTEIFINGIEQYKFGEFHKAARSFETVANNGIQNPYLFYNIGNAYLKSKNIGRAILWYERAKILMPADPDLNFNLEHARTFVTDKKEGNPGIMEVLFFWDNLFTIKTLQMIAICFCLLFFIWASIRTLKRKRVFSGTGLVLLAAVIFVAVIVSEHYYSVRARPCAVIIDQQVSVRSGVSDTATKLFSLHEGTKVVVKDQKNGYFKIVFSKGKVGWVKAEQAMII